jgi:hypothetical protein
MLYLWTDRERDKARADICCVTPNPTKISTSRSKAADELCMSMSKLYSSQCASSKPLCTSLVAAELASDRRPSAA